MSNPSPLVTVQDGANAPVLAANGAATVTASNTITIALISAAGVNNWTCAVIDTDGSVAVPTVTINQVTKTATFTAASGPWSLRFQSQVNDGRDVNGTAQPSYTTTFKICIATATSLRLICTNETFEDTPEVGWVKPLNQAIAAVTSGGGSIPSGTGFVHITSGVQDGSARAINLATADVTGTLPAGNQAAQTLTGDVTGTTGSNTVVTITGSGGSATCNASLTVTPGNLAAGFGNDLILYGGDSSHGVTLKAGGATTLADFEPTGFTFNQPLTFGTGAGVSTITAGSGNTLQLIGGGSTNGLLAKAGSNFVFQLNRSSSDELIFGATPSTSGFVRFPNNTTILTARDPGNANDISILATDASYNVLIGDVAHASTIISGFNYIEHLAPAHTFNSANGSQAFAEFQSTGAEFAIPLMGYSAASAPFSLGLTAKTWPSDADYTFAASEYANPILELSGGSLTATRNGILPNVTGAYFIVHNGTSGSQSVTFKVSGQTGVTVTNGKRAIIYCNGTDYVRLTPDT